MKKYLLSVFAAVGMAAAITASGAAPAFAAGPNPGTDDKLFVPPGAGALARSLAVKAGDMRQSVKDYGAKGDGVTNDTASVTKARKASGAAYYFPNGTYVLDAAPDVFADSFTAGENVKLIVGGTSYDVSNALSGGLRWTRASNVKLNLQDAKTGNTVMYFQNGAAGTATGFYRGLALTTDGHFLQVQPATNGGATDLLFQRSRLNADPAGNRFNLTYEENTDRLLLNYATRAAGAPAFDSAMQIYGGVAPALNFPGLRPNFGQGWTVQTRALGALKLSMIPGAKKHSLTDEATRNEVASYTRTAVKMGGITFNSLLDVPDVTQGPQRWGGNFGDLLTPLPVNKTLFTATGAKNYAVIGTLRVAAATNGGTKAWREARFTYDGTTLTMTDLVNTLPAQIVATVAMSGTNMQFQASYAGGLGGGVAVSASVEWSHAGR